MFSFLSHRNRRILTLIGILIIAASIPLTAMLAQKVQELRGRAAPNGSFVFVSESNEIPITQTSTQNVRLKITLPDGWQMAAKGSEKNLAQNQSIIPKAYATHVDCSSESDSCASCTSFASDCYWEQAGNSGSCKDGVRGECTTGVTWWAYTTGQCNLPFFCPAPTATPTMTPSPTPQGGSGGAPPGATATPTRTPTPQPTTTQPSCRFFRVNNTNNEIPRSSSGSNTSFNVGLNNHTTASKVEVWVNSNTGTIGNAPQTGWTKVAQKPIPNSDSFNVFWGDGGISTSPNSFSEGSHAISVNVFDEADREVANYRTDSDCGTTAQFVNTSTQPPTGGNILSQVHIENVDSNGTGGFDPARITGANLNPYKSGNLLLIPWKINNSNGLHTVEVVLYANNQTVQTPPITATITLTGGPTPIPTPISGRDGGLSYFCQTDTNHVLTAAFSVPSNPPFPCNTYILAETEPEIENQTYQISNDCGNNLTKTMSGKITDIRDPSHNHTIWNRGTYELWSSNDGTPGTRLGRVTLPCGQTGGTPAATATPTPGAGAGPGQGAPEVAKCESVTLDGLSPGSFPLELNKNYNARIVMRNVDPEGTITNQRDWVKSQDKLVALGNTNQIWTPRNPNSPPFTWEEGPDTIGKAPQNDRATFAFTIRTPSRLPETDGYEFKWAMQKSGTSQPFGGACDLAFQASDFTAGAGSGQTIIPVPVLLQEFAAAPNRPARTPRRQSRPDVDVTLILTTDRTKKFEGKINLQWEGTRPDTENLGFFNALINFPPNTLPSGANTYAVQVKEKNHLRRAIGTNFQITTGQEHEIVRVGNLALFAGDMNNDNKVDLSDHQILVNCFGDKINSASCSNKAQEANIDDDEDIDIFDYNWIVENFGKEGDRLP